MAKGLEFLNKIRGLAGNERRQAFADFKKQYDVKYLEETHGGQLMDENFAAKNAPAFQETQGRGPWLAFREKGSTGDFEVTPGLQYKNYSDNLNLANGGNSLFRSDFRGGSEQFSGSNIVSSARGQIGADGSFTLTRQGELNFGNSPVREQTVAQKVPSQPEPTPKTPISEPTQTVAQETASSSRQPLFSGSLSEAKNAVSSIRNATLEGRSLTAEEAQVVKDHFPGYTRQRVQDRVATGIRRSHVRRMEREWNDGTTVSNMVHGGEGVAKPTPTSEMPVSESAALTPEQAAAKQRYEEQLAANERYRSKQATEQQYQEQQAAIKAHLQAQLPQRSAWDQMESRLNQGYDPSKPGNINADNFIDQQRAMRYANGEYDATLAQMQAQGQKELDEAFAQFNVRQREATKVPSKANASSEESQVAPANNSSQANAAWQAVLREKTGNHWGSEGAVEDAISQIQKGQKTLRSNIDLVNNKGMEAKQFEDLYGFRHDAGTADELSQRYAMDQANKGATMSNYIWGNHMPQAGAGIALAGVAASYLTGDGRRSNAQLYSSPF